MREPRSKILIGDVREQLDRIPAGRIQTCVTSPPYFRQRDYGVEGQIGQERTLDEFVETMVDVFSRVRRVLRDDGTLWLNIGDKIIDKQLQGVPWRVALALQADGWVLRSDVIWHDPSKNMDTATDRPAARHEYFFLLSKSLQYFYDKDAVRIKTGREASWEEYEKALNQPTWEGGGQTTHRGQGKGKTHPVLTHPNGRALGSVWDIPHIAESESHFAVFPPKLITPCILAGTSSKGRCPHCYAPRKRITEKDRQPTRPGRNNKVTGDSAKEGNRDPQRHVTSIKTVGWEPTCNCDYKPEEAEPCLVLDPFLGSGTTAAVAVSKGRDAVGIELNPEYAEMAERKIKKARARKGFGVTV